MHRDGRRPSAARLQTPPGDSAARRGRASERAALACMTTSETTTAQSAELSDRIDRYLRQNGWHSPATAVVPLTGDASDRRYFRVIRPDGSSIVLALHTGPI